MYEMRRGSSSIPFYSASSLPWRKKIHPGWKSSQEKVSGWNGSRLFGQGFQLLEFDKVLQIYISLWSGLSLVGWALGSSSARSSTVVVATDILKMLSPNREICVSLSWKCETFPTLRISWLNVSLCECETCWRILWISWSHVMWIWNCRLGSFIRLE